MSHPIRIAVQHLPVHFPNYDIFRQVTARLEDAGVDIIYGYDHFFLPKPDPEQDPPQLSSVQDDNGANFEAYTVMAAQAEQTSRVQLGILVTGVGYRNPDLLADMARTIDHISGGRVILGLGSGWFERDYVEYGYDFGTAGSRIDYLAKSLPRIKNRLSKLNPAPLGKMPILMGGDGEKKMLRLVAEHADIWNSISPPDVLKHKVEVLHRHCADIGRDPKQIELSTIFPSDERIADQLLELGFTQFTVYPFDRNTSGDVPADGNKLSVETLQRAIAWRDKNQG